MRGRSMVMGIGLTMALAASAAAQVPADIEARLQAIGPVIDPAATALIYGPLQAKEPYADAKVARNLAYGPRPRNLLDVFTPSRDGGARPVLIFVPGGQGNKQERVPEGDHFYDNVMLWAVKNGYVGVNMMRESGPGTAWDAGARNIAAVIAWTQANIARYGGDPKRIVLMGHSAGANAMSIYISHPDYYPPTGIGVMGAVLLSGGYNLAPMAQTTPAAIIVGGQAASAPQPDEQTLLARSVLPGLQKATVPMFVAVGDLEPPRQIEVAKMLDDVLCQAGACPAYKVAGESHMSMTFAINTDDTALADAMLAWMRAQKLAQ